MAKLFATVGLLLAVFSVGSNALSLPNSVKVDVVTPKAMKEILKQYPNAVEMSRKVHSQPAPPMLDSGVQSAKVQPNVMIEYYMGSRVYGDWNVAHDHQSHSYGTPQDIQMTLTYPANGGTNGAIVSYVSIFTRQSNYNGRAYVVYGGIGYRYIRIVVEAYDTYIFDHDANFFGY